MGKKWVYVVCALYIVSTGCVTQLQQPTRESVSPAEDIPPEESLHEEAEPAVQKEDEAPKIIDYSPDELQAYIEGALTSGYRVVTMETDRLIQISSPPAMERKSLIAIVTNDRQLALYRDSLTPSGRSEGSQSVEPLALQVSVLSADALKIDDRQGRNDYNGFHLTVVASDREEDLFVVVTATASYAVRTPFSTVNQTVVRDLNDDGLRELVQYSRVFEAGGRRELIVDAFEWDDGGFIHTGSLPLLRRVNSRLNTLKEELERAAAGENRFDAALQSYGDERQPSELFPVSGVRIPELMEVPGDLGRSRWQLEHDIAVLDDEGAPVIYRVTMDIRANPFAAFPVRIEHLDDQGE